MKILAGERGTLDERSAASRAPIRYSSFAEHGAALAANPFHAFKITGSG